MIDIVVEQHNCCIFYYIWSNLWSLPSYMHFHSMELQKRSKELAHKIAAEEAVLRRSTRVRAPPRENPANAFFRYVNKWKED